MSPTEKLVIGVVLVSILSTELKAQDYDVSDIQCSFSTQGTNVKDLIIAKLKRPIGFKGAPLFADDRSVNPEIDRFCTIKQDPRDKIDLTFDLRITDFTKCGVLKRNGFIHVRIWFPQFPGVVMQSDQELIIMCKPPEPTVIENKAAGFAGSFPHGARVSGVVEETPGRLEYEVALYKEAPPAERVNGNNNNLSLNSKESPGIIVNSELPVDQAVPIGTKLQLRARISTQSVWKYVKLMEVTVSPDPEDAHADGSVSLVINGCRNRDFSTIIPHQPARYRDRSNEVFLDFEAFLLSSMKERATLWIHSQIKACMDQHDCQPDFCADMFENISVGRKKRNVTHEPKKSIEFTGFNEFLKYTVIMPGDVEEPRDVNDTCRNFLLLSAALGLLLAISISFICTLIMRQHTKKSNKDSDHYNRGYKGYSGRQIVN